jgi:hypothetical protein
MSPSNVQASSTPAASAREPSRSCRRDEPPTRREGAEFERVLRRKIAARDEPGEQRDATTAPPCESVLPGVPAASGAPVPASSLLRPFAPAGAAAAGVRSEPAASATCASADAAMSAPSSPGAMGAGADDAAGAWSVSLNQPLGLALELRAVRGGATAETPAHWTLTIASPAHDAALLARHAPRLNERLRARALHVRIESDDEASA